MKGNNLENSYKVQITDKDIDNSIAGCVHNCIVSTAIKRTLKKKHGKDFDVRSKYTHGYPEILISEDIAADISEGRKYIGCLVNIDRTDIELGEIMAQYDDVLEDTDDNECASEWAYHYAEKYRFRIVWEHEKFIFDK